MAKVTIVTEEECDRRRRRKGKETHT